MLRSQLSLYLGRCTRKSHLLLSLGLQLATCNWQHATRNWGFL